MKKESTTILLILLAIWFFFFKKKNPVGSIDVGVGGFEFPDPDSGEFSEPIDKLTSLTYQTDEIKTNYVDNLIKQEDTSLLLQSSTRHILLQ